MYTYTYMYTYRDVYLPPLCECVYIHIDIPVHKNVCIMCIYMHTCTYKIECMHIYLPPSLFHSKSPASFTWIITITSCRSLPTLS